METALIRAPAPIPTPRSNKVVEALTRLAAERRLLPGDKLPTERDLTAALGVGRSSIREAVRQLAALGVVEARVGSGTYLKRPISPDTVYLPLALDSADTRDALLMTLEVRRGIEIEASMAAARRRSDADLARIESALDHMEAVHLAEGTSGRADLALHLAIYDAAHNPLFNQLLEQMRHLFERFWDQPFDRPDFAARSFPFHRTLFEAIRDRDPDRAATETRKILDIVEEDIRNMSQ